MIWSPQEIKRRRDAKGWTQQQLADAVGASRRAVIGWEAGTAVPQGRFIGQMETVLGEVVREDEADQGVLLRDADFAQTINHLIDLHNSEVRNRIQHIVTTDERPLPTTLHEAHDVVEGPKVNAADQVDDDERQPVRSEAEDLT